MEEEEEEVTTLPTVAVAGPTVAVEQWVNSRAAAMEEE